MPLTSVASAGDALQAYLRALACGDAGAAAEMFHARALLEIPFLKPNRLVGTAEIAEAHRAIFARLDSLAFDTQALHSNETHAIAEGRLHFSRDGGEAHAFTAGIVAESGADGLLRISLYCDARNVRPWSDEAIL